MLKLSCIVVYCIVLQCTLSLSLLFYCLVLLCIVGYDWYDWYGLYYIHTEPMDMKVQAPYTWQFCERDLFGMLKRDPKSKVFLWAPTIGDKEVTAWITCLENKLLLISINFTPKTSHCCLKKWYTRFSRWCIYNSNHSESFPSKPCCRVAFLGGSMQKSESKA